MMRIHFGLTSAVLTLSLFAGTGYGWAQEGAAGRAGTRVGEVLDNAGRSIKRGVQGASESVRESMAKSRVSVHNQEVLSRIYSRLHWDKDLTSSTLDLEVQAGGVAFLRGVVPDAVAKSKAVALTRDTVGVLQVVDQLSLLPPARTISAPAPDVIPVNP